MRADVTPSRVQLTPRTPVSLVVTVTNTLPIIMGYTISVLGLDPAAVTCEPSRLALWPNSSRTATLTLNVPPDLPAGKRTLTVAVNARARDSSVLLPVELEIPAEPKLTLRLNPRSVTAGRRAPFGLIAENEGNSHIRLPLIGVDDESAVRYTFNPSHIDVEPGGRQALDVELTARRRLAGQLAVRPFVLKAGDPEKLDAGAEPLARAAGTFIQRPVVSRGAFSLAGLIAVVSVFALILTVTLTRVSSQSSADRDLALAVALGSGSGGATGSSGIAGRVSLLTSGDGVGGVTVEVFNDSDTSNAVATAATDDNGAYGVSGLPAGSYKIRYRGAGFAELWYPDALTDSDATSVNVSAATVSKGLDVKIGGLPATISGTVTGVTEAGAGATVTLQVAGTGPPVVAPLPDNGTAGAGGFTAPLPIIATPAPGVASPVPAIATTPNLPAAPSLQATAVSAQIESPRFANVGGRGPAVARQRGTAVARKLGTVVAKKLGTVVASTPEPHAAVPSRAGRRTPGSEPSPTPYAGPSASDPGLAGAVIQTVTADSGGAFSFTQVPSPATYDLIVQKAGFAVTAERIDVTGGEVRKAVLVRLQQGDGIIAGRISDFKGPVGLATLTASNGTVSIQTYSDTSGAFTLRGLTTPGSYIVSVAKAGYATQQLAFSLSTAQQLTNVTVSLSRAASSLSGVVSTLPPATLGDSKPQTTPAGGVAVTVTNGQMTLTTETASAGGSLPTGSWSLTGLPVATTYTVTFARADLASLTASVSLDGQGSVVGGDGADPSQLSPTLTSATAVIHGLVTQANGGVPLGGIALSLMSTANTYSVTTATQAAGGAAVGYFEVDDIAPGTYTISAGRTGSTPATYVLVLKAGDDVNYPLSLSLPASVSGTVFDNTSDRQPVARAEVHLYTAANYPNNPTATVITDSHGHYSFPTVDAPMSYVVDADSPIGSPPSTSETFTIAAKEAKTVDLYLSCTAGAC